MKKNNSILRFAAASAIVLTGAAFCFNADAQILSDLLNQQEGTSVYSLPSTSIKLDVEAECVAFTAGPYAKYAQKYFGIDAKTEDGVSYTLSSVKMTPYVEADPNANYSIKLDRKNLMPAFLQFTSQGLVVLSSAGAGQSEIWRFPSQVQGKSQETAGGIESNLTDATTTLYKTVKSDNGSFETVPVQQKQLVAKTEEQKAAEAAEQIFTLRQSRNNIVTGNTDATFSGEALEAAVKEINRLEKEYLSMFIGKESVSVQKMSFDVVPNPDNAKQLYIAFRLSDTQGLLPADNVAGRPIVLELSRDKNSGSQTGTSDAARRGSGQAVYYRIPAVVTAKVIDGQDVLMQGRVPVYQLGTVATFGM